MKSQPEPLSGGMEVSNRTVQSIKDSLQEYEHDVATLRSVLESEKAHKNRKTAVEAISAAIDGETETMSNNTEPHDSDEMEQAANKLANALGENVAEYADKASLSGSQADVVATAVIRKTSAGAAGYTAVFGECGVADCDRGCNGFGAETCDQHSQSDLGGSQSNDSETGGNALSDLSPEQIEALPESVVRDKLE